MSDHQLDPNVDLSVLDPDAKPDFVMGSDQEVMRKINRRTSPITKLLVLATIAGVAGLAFWAYTSAVNKEKRIARLEALGEIEDPGQLKTELRSLLAEAEDVEIKRRVIMNLGHYKDAEAVPALTEQLQEKGIVRRAAAWALGEIGLPAAGAAKDALLATIPDTNEVDKAQVVWTLALLREERASDDIVSMFSVGRLQNMDHFEARVITDVLGIARLSNEDLLGHNEESVRVLTAHALAEVAGPDVVAPLSRQLELELAREGEAQSSEVIRATAAGLGRTNDARAGAPLFQMMQSQPGMRQTVIEALRRSTAAPSLATLLGGATDESVKRDLVRLIAETHDDRAADTLAGLLGDADKEVRSTAAFALAQFGDARAMDTLFALAADQEDDATMSSAIESLRYIASPAATDRLVQMLADNPFRKAAILKALGATGDPRASRAIQGELGGDDVRSAALALAFLGDDSSYRRLVDMAKRPRNKDMTAQNAADRSLPDEPIISSRKAAIIALGKFGRTEATETLMTIVEDEQDDYELRALAAASIGQISDAETMSTILQKVTSDPAVTELSKTYYVQALWQRPHAELSGQLLDVLASDAPGDIKRTAALALGYAANPANDARLVTMLENEATARYAGLAIGLGGGDDAVATLITKIGESRDLAEILQMNWMNESNDWFNLAFEPMFENDGSIWRRLRAASLLKTGQGDASYSYFWQKTVNVLRSGWEGTNGASPQFIRNKLWEALAGEDAQKRELAAAVFADLPERGLLLRARDSGGATEEVARGVLD